MIIKFNSIEEFNEELQKEFSLKPGMIARVFAPIHQTKTPVMRMTCLYRSSANVPIKTATVVATIKSARDPQDIIRLDKYCGDIWGIGSEDEKTRVKIEEAYTPIQKACQALGIEVRAGIYEPEK